MVATPEVLSIGEVQKKSTRLQVSCFREIIGEEQKKGLHDCRCPFFVKISVKSEKNVLSGIAYILACWWCHITHRRIIYYPSGVIYPQVGNHWCGELNRSGQLQISGIIN